jgi:hypothetical protein
MTGNISRADLVLLAQRLGIDRPIMAHRVVGSRVELYPLGGGCYQADLPAGDRPWLDDNDAWRPAQLPYLAELVVFLQENEDIGREELYTIAQRLKLRGRSTMDATTLRNKALAKARRLRDEGEIPL